jgi:hypothetical protein
VAAAALTIWSPQISETNFDLISRDVADRAQVFVRHEQNLQAINLLKLRAARRSTGSIPADHPLRAI